MSLVKEEIWHCVPRNDLREHETKASCWCHPTQHPEHENYWIHHSMDRREEYETGERKAS